MEISLNKLFDFSCIFYEEIEFFTIQNKGNLLFGLFRAGSFDFSSGLKLLQKKKILR